LTGCPRPSRKRFGNWWPTPPSTGVAACARVGLAVEAVDLETALLWHTLQEPGALPCTSRRKFGAHCDEAVSELVLSSVLEIFRRDDS